MKHHITLAVFCVLCMAAVIISGCLTSPAGPPVTPTPTPVQTPGEAGPATLEEMAVVDANNRFALDAYTTIRNDPAYQQGNLFFSPFSLSSALAITYEGARGTTAEEIRSVFHFPKDDAIRRGGFQELYRGINQGNARYTLKTANALWAEKTYAFLPAYMQTAREYYGANATNLDFVNQPEPSRLTINRWVEDQTENRIRDLIPPGVIDPLTRLVITNAVYFKGTWVKQFDANRTKESPFTVTPGTTVPVQMMERTDEDAIFNYTETSTVQVLRMPYASDGGKRLSMLVILPDEGSLGEIDSALSNDFLDTLSGGLQYGLVNLYLKNPCQQVGTKEHENWTIILSHRLSY